MLPSITICNVEYWGGGFSGGRGEHKLPELNRNEIARGIEDFEQYSSM
jgi:hypothetical protein